MLLKEPKSSSSRGPGKPGGIDRFIGRRPFLAFGNSDWDHRCSRAGASAGPRFI